MKRDMELVRQLMLFLEERNCTSIIMAAEIPIPGASEAEVQYHLNLIYQAGFLNCEQIKSSTSDRIIRALPFDLTWQGHEFLDDIRDPEIWRVAKASAASAGGASVQFVWSVAKAMITKAIQEKTGLNLS